MKSRLKAFFTDERSALMIRWWAAGAVYFFVGWGTSIGQQSMIGLILSLSLIMGLLNILIINPSLRMVFNIGSAKRPKHEDTFFQRLSDRLVELLKTLFIVATVAMIYVAINSAIIIIRDLPSDAVPLPGEPIMFGIFYVFVFWCLDVLVKKTKIMLTSRGEVQSHG